MSNRSQTGQEALFTFVQSLYNELFSAICSILSKSMDHGAPHSWITLLDSPGASFNQQWTHWGGDRPLRLTDLVYNYFNERLAELYYDHNFRNPAEVYAREQVEVSVDKPPAAPHSLTRLLDRKPQLVREYTAHESPSEWIGLDKMRRRGSSQRGATRTAPHPGRGVQLSRRDGPVLLRTHLRPLRAVATDQAPSAQPSAVRAFPLHRHRKYPVLGGRVATTGATIACSLHGSRSTAELQPVRR